MCGGSPTGNAKWASNEGLSPRVRGKLAYELANYYHSRSIPACAGEAPADTRALSVPRVYPRVCGGSGKHR